MNRKCSVNYGSKAVNEFLEENDLLCIVRAHEVKQDGYQLHMWNGEEEFPPVVTVFSAPNYCDIYNNKAAVFMYEEERISVRQFNYTPHPFVLPDNMNLFEWSMPFLTSKVAQIMLSIIRKGEEICEQEEDDSESQSEEPFPSELRYAAVAALDKDKHGSCMQSLTSGDVTRYVCGVNKN